MDTKKLRQKILDLAIRGKLVPQDPNDEPASVLLERIRAEKERLIKEGKIKRSKKSASDDEIEAPFEIPESWEWVRLDDLCDIKGGKRIPHGMNFSKVPTEHVYLRVTNMKCHTIIENEIKYIDEEVFQIIKNYTISSDDLYLTIAGTIGDVGEIPLKFSNMNLTENAAKLTNLLCDKQFLMYALLSTAVQNHFSSKFHQVAQPKLSIETASSAIIALPPLSEQKRIASAVERWFTLIDELESNEGDLLKAIDKAKSKILDLAIHGKLVPQDPNDEPASALLEHIRAKKGKIKRSKKSASDDEIEAPFEIPESWEWVRLDALCDIKGGKRIPRGMNFSKVPTEHVYLRVTNMKCHTIIENEIKYIDEEVFQIIKNYTISSDDLYLTIAGTIGDVGVIPLKFSNMNLTENAAKLTNLVCDKQFLMYALLSTSVQNHFSSKFHQVAQPKLSIETASSAFIALPPLAEQKRIVAKIEELFAVLDSIKESLE